MVSKALITCFVRTPCLTAALANSVMRVKCSVLSWSPTAGDVGCVVSAGVVTSVLPGLMPSRPKIRQFSSAAALSCETLNLLNIRSRNSKTMDL
ncbi:hypothetical protein BCR44DRAFT_1447431, partial [Catenaria anguillulae PL171]